MKITIILHQRQARTDCDAAVEKYMERLRPHADVEFHQIRKWDDGTGLPSKLLSRSRVIGLYVDGESFTSPGLSQHLQKLLNGGYSSIVIVIGAADGMPRQAASEIHERWSLSPLTFPHQLMKLLIVEALYRSFDLMRGGSYHK